MKLFNLVFTTFSIGIVETAMEWLLNGILLCCVFSTVDAQSTVVQLNDGGKLRGKQFSFNNTNVHIFLGKLKL